MKNTMKRIVAVILLVAISLSCFTVASAGSGDEYYSKVIRNLDMSSSEMTKNRANRVTIAALILLEAIMKDDDGLDMYDRVKATGTCYIAKYGTCIDVYYPVSSSKYLNLFLTPSTGKIKNYGYVSYNGGSSSYTYTKLTMSDVWSDFSELIEMIYDD
ncbi:MAG: hypothetical protein IJ174_04565 [Clostridia bacterium]|nr:hypothetical protein [Clostridia bacterium]